ncbi:hypothetical protein [Flaviaesturariibacter amylovorans]|uniref:DUF3168 domain-containing protein n=1 Tax=Flaviaesturariibacter amylovorans TaxID=1084520 RepID=A0ABP8GQT2_9BACT
MKTTLEIETLIWQHLAGSALKAALTGGIYKMQRPSNSKVEDVVIVSLPVNNLALQGAVVNVNIHVPDLPVRANEVTGGQPHHTRLQQLAAQAIGILQDTWDEAGEWTWDVQQQNVFKDDEGGGHFVNIRLEFYSINS